MTAYQELACAIVEKAISDYRKALRQYKANKEAFELSAKAVDELESFFKSKWFDTLCNVDGLFIIDKICEQELFDGK